ncbi:MAG: MFS transporter, partial [Pseudomonadota bacterium]
MGVSALIFGWLLSDFSKLQLIRVIQGSAVVTIALNLVALWKQEAVRPMSKEEREAPAPLFSDAWADLMAGGKAGRLLLAVFLGTMAFAMQDILLEPYGGEILGLSVSQTTLLTAFWAAGALVGFALAARKLSRNQDPIRIAALGLVSGIFAFSAVVFAAPLGSALLFSAGATLIGFGGGLFAVALLTRAMELAEGGARAGLALGAWGAASATATGLGVASGGILKDWVASLAASGRFGPEFTDPALGYQMVYHLEILLLFVTLIVIGRLVRRGVPSSTTSTTKFGLAELPV